MKNAVELEIVERIEDTKFFMESELIWRKVKSRDEDVERLEIEMEGTEGSDEKEEVVKLPIDK